MSKKKHTQFIKMGDMDKDKPMNVFKLGTVVTMGETGIEGKLTHLDIGSDGSFRYVFKPLRNSDNIGKCKGIWIPYTQVTGGKLCVATAPTHVIGKPASIRHESVTGIIRAVTLHMNGCVHVDIQMQNIAPDNMVNACVDAALIEIDCADMRDACLKYQTFGDIPRSPVTGDESLYSSYDKHRQLIH